MATKAQSVDLSTMSSAQRLAFYKQANEARRASPKGPSDSDLGETLGKAVGSIQKGTRTFGENFMASYRYHKE